MLIFFFFFVHHRRLHFDFSEGNNLFLILLFSQFSSFFSLYRELSFGYQGLHPKFSRQMYLRSLLGETPPFTLQGIVTSV